LSSMVKRGIKEGAIKGTGEGEKVRDEL
jgi:hypothetical protein